MPQTAPAASPLASAAPSSFLVFFDFDAADITPEASRILVTASKAIAAQGRRSVQIVGYADSSGSADYNLKLSMRRSKAVEQGLISNGVPAQTIVLKARGESDQLLQTADGVREPQNRRATIEFIAP